MKSDPALTSQDSTEKVLNYFRELRTIVDQSRPPDLGYKSYNFKQTRKPACQKCSD